MPRKVLIKIRRGPEASLGALDDGEFGYCTDTKKLYIGTTSGNVLLLAAQTVGDMLKSIYDTNNNGVVDLAASVPWAGITGIPDGIYRIVTGATEPPGLVAGDNWLKDL